MPSSDSEETQFEEEIPEVDPYKVLSLDKTANEDDIKKAYRKAALKHHPDKSTDKGSAHTKFQEIACAYAVLSDPTRRKRYDTTGSTSESIVDSDGFNWSDFYNEQYRDAISVDAIEKFAKKYKESTEEKDDLLVAYEQAEGDMEQVFNTVMLSDRAEDEERFRVIIDEAIKNGDVEEYAAYAKETKAQKKRRMKATDKEAKEAMEYAEELGVADKLFGKGKGKGKGASSNGEDDLAALIRSRNEAKGSSFLDQLEAKYAPKSKKRKTKS